MGRPGGGRSRRRQRAFAGTSRAHVAPPRLAPATWARHAAAQNYAVAASAFPPHAMPVRWRRQDGEALWILFKQSLVHVGRNSTTVCRSDFGRSAFRSCMALLREFPRRPQHGRHKDWSIQGLFSPCRGRSMHPGLVATPSPARAASRGIGPESCRLCWGRLGLPPDFRRSHGGKTAKVVAFASGLFAPLPGSIPISSRLSLTLTTLACTPANCRPCVPRCGNRAAARSGHGLPDLGKANLE